MRPVQLDMTGFASFRERAVVDFTDADHFALVGPTGSGKSTVIDAMTFALYGSAPRWGRTTAIADALAPTTNRCTVRLVFDIGDARYAVAREVRRVGKTVQQKNAVLERLPDRSGTGAEGEPPGEVIAGDLKEVTRTVESLLGLSFSDFCQCIVLPQGKFAEFLGATPKDRQEILLKLLGAGHYEAIARSAASRAALAGEAATVLAAQLGTLAEATEDAEAAARAREVELAALADAVDEALPVIAEQAGRVTAATAEHERLTDEQARLARVRMPDGIPDLQQGLDGAERERVLALEREVAASDSDTRARAELAKGPSRPRLEATISRRQELAALTARGPAVAAADEAAGRDRIEAETAVAAGEQAVSTARDTREQARQVLAETGAAHQVLVERRERLAAIDVPDGIEALGARTATARTSAERARSRRETAETADQQARDALRQAPARGPLQQARADLIEADALRQRLEALDIERAMSVAALDEAHGAVRPIEGDVVKARHAYDAAIRDHTAAALRPQLAAGHACPVCDQVVVTVPPPLAAPELEAAQQELALAEDLRARLQRSLIEVTHRVSVRDAEIDVTGERLAKLGVALEGQPTHPDLVTAELARIDALAAATEAAAEELTAARAGERAAAAALDGLDRETSAARTRLLATHGPLIALGAPAVDDSDLPAAWTALTGWAGQQAGDLEGRLLPESAKAVAAATTAHEKALAATEQREQERRQAQRSYTAAVQAAARAGEQHQTLTARLGELGAALAGAPSIEDATEQLAACTRLEQSAARAGEVLLATRAARTAAEQDRSRWEATAIAARRELGAARDRLVPLGAPELDDTDVAAGWAGLLAWASEQAAARAAGVPGVRERIETATAEHAGALAALRARLAEQDLDGPDGPDGGGAMADGAPAGLPARVATVLERARARTRSVVEKRSRAATLGTSLATAQEEQQVARLLADLLRSDKFPRWLASAALDTLVTDASAVLSDLSGGQFDLAHERGEFVVIDHTDADSRRSVRTLSGGETFQASLALALALSAQMSTLAAEGAARLDSIFLDEGFGTLDPDTLEVVAGTLENLADGNRMVGVITHVAALAERAPVRFAVHRDSRTSTITRESA